MKLLPRQRDEPEITQKHILLQEKPSQTFAINTENFNHEFISFLQPFVSAASDN